jgi:hypothetical protein
MLYIHHVPGRLRLQTSQLKGNRPVAEAACDDVIAMPGVLKARVSCVTGSLVIAYNPRELTPAVLWQFLCQRGLASGPLPISEGAVTRTELDPLASAVGTSLVELIVGIILKGLLERSAAKLVGALI